MTEVRNRKKWNKRRKRKGGKWSEQTLKGKIKEFRTKDEWRETRNKEN